ncbi:chromatin accessibility complex protein 1 [Hyperolius riggenbachi]|uniref:chromatin accessibility complex protein 1 n=1 Tax=Hyperolius riggenbachi TaxID=752182 RepID=UPI0035A2D04F
MAESQTRVVTLPLSRIRVIMKSSPDVSSINPDALVLTAKATELFVKYLASYSYRNGTGKEDSTLTYDDLSNTAEKSDTFQFLSDILPKKILASDYLKTLKKVDEDGYVEEEGEEEDDDEEEEGEEGDEDEDSVDSDDDADEDYEQDDNDDEEEEDEDD